jgi:mannitol 2-dehydrogenase
MVDRITPVTTRKDTDLFKSRLGIDDRWPVFCEPFIQWIIEDNFSNGRPPWERVGVQFVEEVEPYEKMKIRLLNAGHSLLGFAGSLAGYSTIDETVSDPLIAKLLRKFMDREVTPLLGDIKGIDPEEYKNVLVKRFENPNIKDKLSRICGESSAKIPKFLLPTIYEQLKAAGPMDICVFVVAAWCRYLELAGTPGFNYKIQDVMADELQQAALASIAGDPLSFLRIKPVFGVLVDNSRFVETYLEIIDNLHRSSVLEVIKQLIN